MLLGFFGKEPKRCGHRGFQEAARWARAGVADRERRHPPGPVLGLLLRGCGLAAARPRRAAATAGRAAHSAPSPHRRERFPGSRGARRPPRGLVRQERFRVISGHRNCPAATLVALLIATPQRRHMMARNVKSSAKAERADHRLPPDERLDREAADGLLPLEELDRPPDSRLTAGDLKRAAARATGVMGTSKKLDPSLKIPHTRESVGSSSTEADGSKRNRGAAAATDGLDKGSVKTAGGSGGASTRVTKSNAQIAEGVTS